jgi:hypothetical protein
MDNVFDEVRLAVSQAKDTLRAADMAAADMAALLRGRLHQVKNAHVLRELKRELRDFDMTTGQWKP